MRLLEIVRGKATGKEVIATSHGSCRRSWARSACWSATAADSSATGCSVPTAAKRSSWWRKARRVEAVDKALYDFGMAMGPLAMGDLAGLDVGWRIRKEYAHLEKPGIRQPMRRGPPVRNGPLRPEDRCGLVRYDENRRAVPDPEVETTRAPVDARKRGIEQREIGPSGDRGPLHLRAGQ